MAGALGGSAAAATAAEALLTASAARDADGEEAAAGVEATPYLAPGGGCAAGGRMADAPFPILDALCALAKAAG